MGFSVTPMKYYALLFFLVTAFFALTWRDGHYNSPDETANAFFIRQYVQTGSFRVAEPLNVVGENIIHPRAMQIVQHDLAPGSFLGMLLLYGWIAKILGVWIVPLLTPIFATIASFFFYKLVRLFFDERVARWSFFLLLINPAWIYYTARSMFPNVLFLSLIIIGLHYLLHASKSLYPIRYTLYASLLIGAALAVRTSEAGWVLAGLLLLYFLHLRQNHKKHQKSHYTELVLEHEFGITRVLVFFAGVLVAFLPIFYYNMQIYGHPLYNGYSQIDSEAVPAAFAWHFQSRFLSTIFSLLLPFGIKPLVLLQNAYDYLIWFFWWLAVPMVLGVVALIQNQRITESKNQKHKSVFMFSCFYVFMTVWLLLYYGSWVFRDTTLAGPTLGTSYVRYWLPIFIFGLPFAAFILSQQKRFVTRVVLIGIIVLSSWSVFWNNGESLFAIRKSTREGRSVSAAVFSRTEANAVILTERSDKLFFPERRVIFNDPLDQKKIDRVVALLAYRVPVYYFTELQKSDIDFGNERRLVSHGVAWSGGEEVGGQRLYRLEKF